MVAWHHQLNGYEFEQAPGVGDGQGSLACCSPWGHKGSNMIELLNSNNTTYGRQLEFLELTLSFLPLLCLYKHSSGWNARSTSVPLFPSDKPSPKYMHCEALISDSPYYKILFIFLWEPPLEIQYIYEYTCICSNLIHTIKIKIGELFIFTSLCHR